MSDQWIDRYHSYLMNTTGNPYLILERGHGCYVTDIEGNDYLDLLSGIAVNALGYGHKAITEALANQAPLLMHTSNLFGTRPQIELAEKILSIVEPGGASKGSAVFFTNSGAEANECALKLIRVHGKTLPHKPTKILALENAFHGRTTGALSVTYKHAYREPFEPLLPDVEFLPFGDIDALKSHVNEDVAGLILEPIQGEAGVRILDREYLRTARELTKAHGAFLVVDEVQTGLGRTGAWMAHHDSGIVPDVVTLAKTLGGGFPIGACIGLGEAGSVFTPGMHGTTFGGNPLGAAVSLAVLSAIDSEGLIDNARVLGEQWKKDLLNLKSPLVKKVRGRGLLVAIDLAEEIAKEVLVVARENGFIINNTSSNTLRLAPPLIITSSELSTFTQRFTKILAEASRRHAKTA